MNLQPLKFSHPTNTKDFNLLARNNELSKVLRILLKERQNNPILIGDKGVGKTSIVNGLSNFFQSKKTKLDFRVFELNVDDIVDALLGGNEITINTFTKHDIYFINNSSLLFSSTLQESRKTSKFFNWLIRTTGCRFILAMTSTEYRKFIEIDPILSSIFDTVKIERLNNNDLSQILSTYLKNISYDPNIIEEVIRYSDRYIKGNEQPSKSISILDESIAFINFNDKKYISSNEIKKIIAEKSGIPVESLEIDEREKLTRLENTLNTQVVGQEYATKKISEVLKRARAGIKDPNRPLASFLFVGSSGVGKTEMAKVLAEVIFNSRTNLIRLDMSEYAETHNVQRLVGAPPGYVGYEEGGQLTNPVYDNPYSLLLLDELEKANSKVHDIFLQVLDEGRLTDGQGRTVDFRNTVIISTSNAAYSNILEGITDYSVLNDDSFVKAKVIPNLVKFFRPEFLNRFDEIIMFSPLNLEQLNRIAELQILKLEQRLKEQGITFQISNDTFQKIISSGKSKIFGAREVNRLVQKHIENPIANNIIQNPDQKHIYI